MIQKRYEKFAIILQFAHQGHVICFGGVMLHSATFVKLRLSIPRREFTSKLGIYSRECRSEGSPSRLYLQHRSLPDEKDCCLSICLTHAINFTYSIPMLKASQVAGWSAELEQL